MNKHKLRYALLREIEHVIDFTEDFREQNTKYEELNPSTFGVSLYQLEQAIEFLEIEGYITGVSKWDGGYHLKAPFLRVTSEGEAYLKGNTAFAKVYKGLKEVKGWIGI